MAGGSGRRVRSKTMAFRVTPEEYEEICELARLSGMDRQDYIVSRLKNKEIVVKPSPRVHKALKEDMAKVYTQLLRIRQGGALGPSLERTIQLLGNFFVGLEAATGSADDMESKEESIRNMNRK